MYAAAIAKLAIENHEIKAAGPSPKPVYGIWLKVTNAYPPEKFVLHVFVWPYASCTVSVYELPQTGSDPLNPTLPIPFESHALVAPGADQLRYAACPFAIELGLAVIVQ